MTRFIGKAVLVTGGGGAIGSAAALRFANEGAHVVVVDIDGDAANRVAAGLGASALAVQADVADEGEAARAVDRALDAFGRLDVLFNNAGISGTVAPVHELPVEDWDHIVRVNLRGMFLMLRVSLRAMIERRTAGAIVNMGSSMAGWDVLAGGAGYVSTKHAVVGLTRVAALDAAPYGIRVNAICPGVVQTRLGVPADDPSDYARGIERFARRIPLRRIGQPADIAAAVAFLASDDARHVTGVDWLIDGGQTLQSFANGPADDAYPRHTET